MIKYTYWVAALTLASCGGDSITPKLGLQFDAKRNSGGLIMLSVTVKNEINRPTVPLLVEVDAVEAGGKATPVIQPAAFVLNRQEARTMTGRINTPDSVTFRLLAKEAERGILLKTMSKTVDAAK